MPKRQNTSQMDRNAGRTTAPQDIRLFAAAWHRLTSQMYIWSCPFGYIVSGAKRTTCDDNQCPLWGSIELSFQKDIVPCQNDIPLPHPSNVHAKMTVPNPRSFQKLRMCFCQMYAQPCQKDKLEERSGESPETQF